MATPAHVHRLDSYGLTLAGLTRLPPGSYAKRGLATAWARRGLFVDSERRLVDQNSASWNRIADCAAPLRGLAGRGLIRSRSAV